MSNSLHSLRKVFLQQKLIQNTQVFPYTYIFQYNNISANDWKKIKNALALSMDFQQGRLRQGAKPVEHSEKLFKPSERGKTPMRSQNIQIIPSKLRRPLHIKTRSESKPTQSPGLEYAYSKITKLHKSSLEFGSPLTKNDEHSTIVSTTEVAPHYVSALFFPEIKGPCCIFSCYSPIDLNTFYTIIRGSTSTHKIIGQSEGDSPLKLHLDSFFHIALQQASTLKAHSLDSHNMNNLPAQNILPNIKKQINAISKTKFLNYLEIEKNLILNTPQDVYTDFFRIVNKNTFEVISLPIKALNVFMRASLHTHLQ